MRIISAGDAHRLLKRCASPKEKIAQSDNPVCILKFYTHSLHSLNIKKGISLTSLNGARKALILALNDSAKA